MNLELIIESLESLTSDELVILKNEIESQLAIRDFTEDYNNADTDEYDDEYDDEDY
jgi:hypothetical protein